MPGIGPGRLLRTTPLCVVEVPLGAPEALAVTLDEYAVAGAPADVRAALADAVSPSLVLIDPACPPAQLDRVIAAAGLLDGGEAVDGPGPCGCLGRASWLPWSASLMQAAMIATAVAVLVVHG